MGVHCILSQTDVKEQITGIGKDGNMQPVNDKGTLISVVKQLVKVLEDETEKHTNL